MLSYYFVYFLQYIKISKNINIKSMLRNLAYRITKRYTSPFMFSSVKEEGQSFLKMVESYFDKAGIHTGIRSDYLNFYKKPDNVVKCTYPIIRGNLIS